MTVMGNAFFRDRIDISRLLSVFVAIAFIMASAGAGHTMSVSHPHGHPLESASSFEGACHADSSRVPDCEANEVQHDHGKPPHHGALGSCCVVTCSPSIAVTFSTEAGIINLSVIRLRVHVDQLVDSIIPDGLFRPPRAFA